MRTRGACGLIALVALFVVAGCLIFAALAGALVLTGEVSLYSPRLTGLEPEPGYAFRPTTPVTLTFDQPMRPASVEAAFALEPPVPGTFRWNKEFTQVTFVPDGAGYEPGMAYTARLSAGGKAGTLPLDVEHSVEWGFTLPNLVDELEPVPGAEGLGPHSVLLSTFFYSLDCAATARAFSITPDVLGVLGCKEQTVTFEPIQALEADTAYVASLESVYLEGDPWPRPGVVWEFRTAPPLAVEEMNPPAAGFLIDLWSPFSVRFNRAVVADSAVSRFSLMGEGGKPVGGLFSWVEDGAILVFQPEEPLKPAAQYRLVLQDGVQDELGFELAESVERSYTTPPMLGVPLPLPGSGDVALDSTIRVPFTGPMDRTSVEAGLLVSPELDGEMAWEEDTLVFIPRGGLAPETIFQVSLDADIRDASGAPLGESHQWSFATEAFLLDAKTPQGAMLADLEASIAFQFALPMDRASLDAALIVSPTTQGDLIWSDGDRTITYQPEPGWLPGAEYEITLSGLASTADGSQSLGEDRTYGFTTAVAEVRFGQGPNVQVMGLEGERSFQVVARGANMADFRLHAITSTQFLDLYSAGFWGMGSVGAPLMMTTGLTPTVEWREALVPLDGQADGEWQPAEAHIPAEVPAGIYVLSSEPVLEEQSQLLVVLTEHGLVLKRALAGSGSRTQAEVVAWDSKLDGGTPVVSATVRLYDGDGVMIVEGVTGADGIMVLDVPGDPGPLMALAEKDGDVTVSGLGSEWRDSGWWWTSPPSRPLYVAYSYTDRPIYRPGQTIYFKHFVRADDDVSYRLPALDQPVIVRLRDARDNVVATQVLTLTQFGTGYGEFQLTDEPMLGTWNLETEIGGEIARQALEVEEYRKPEYEVIIHTPQKAYAHGEEISVTVEADYYFGQPVAGADVVLRGYPAYSDDFNGEGELLFGYPVLSEEGQTDVDGRWSLVLPIDEVMYGRDNGLSRALLALEATVTDDTGLHVSSYQTVVVMPTSQGLSVVVEGHGYLPNEEIAFGASVRSRDGEPVAGAELTAHAVGWDEDEVVTVTALTNEVGEATFSVRLAEQGWYRLRVTGDDENGREMVAEDHVWIHDPTGQAPWYGGHWDAEPTLGVSVERATYAVGDEAQLVIYSPLAGPALLTFERGQTHRAEPITLTAGPNLISVPVRAEYAPNIYVTVSKFDPLAAGRLDDKSRPEVQLKKASAQLLVPMTDQQLSVTLTTEQETFAPGDEVTLHIQTLDHQGQPVVAETSVAVVDEAIYVLAEDVTQGPFEVLYGPRPNIVRTFDSLAPQRWLFTQLPAVGGGEEMPGGPRHDFLDTAFWSPTVDTDDQGQASVTLKLPDNLTEWRILTRAITTDTLVGQASTRILVRKDIIVRPVVPRFLVQGDSLAMGVEVQNSTAQPASATVQVELDGLVMQGEPSQLIHVPAGGSALASWWVRADEAGEAQITVRATASRAARLVGRDAVTLSLPVHPLAIPEITTWAGELTPAKPTATVTLTVPGEVITGLSRLEVNLAASVVPGLLDGLEYLIGYPYGCVEQTMSRALPNAMVAQVLGDLGVRDQRIEADLAPMIDLGLQKLYGYQHDDGGWGWWYDDSTDVNQTAYVLFGLSMTEQAGYEVDEGVMDRGAEALRRMLPAADLRAQAYGIYALATAGQPVSVTMTLTDALALDLFSQAAMAIALDAAEDEPVLLGSRPAIVAALLDSLRESTIEDGTTAHWEEVGEDASYGRTVMGSPVRTTAKVVDALVRLDPESPLLPKAIRWLMEQRKGGGWGDTQNTSHTILALANYLLASRELASGSAYRVYLNGDLWQEGVLDRPEAGQALTVPITALVPAENRVQLALGEEGERPTGRLYYDVALVTNRAPGQGSIPAFQAGERGIGVQREYRLPGSQEPATDFQIGDLVEVRLTLDVPYETWYVIVQDPLPAGFEALNERLGTTSHVAAAYEEPTLYWESYGYNRKDVRDEGVNFFATRLDAGQRTFSYLARAIAEGSFATLPTQVYSMYEPGVWSRSESGRYEIEAR